MAIRINPETIKIWLLKKVLWLKPALKQLSARMEVQFWGVVTYWMSESRLVQAWVVKAFLLKDRLARNWVHLLRQGLVWAGAGWLAGLLIGMLSF
jgi:hypothetical protein